MEIEHLVEDDRIRGVFRVHRSSMTSAESVPGGTGAGSLTGAGLYIGHDSEVENPGDYRRRTVAGRPVFLVRNRDGEVRVFLNSCTHRGALVCRRDAGNASVFQCFFHAWTFNTNGELIGVPGEDAYGPAFDRKGAWPQAAAPGGQLPGFLLRQFQSPGGGPGHLPGRGQGLPGHGGGPVKLGDAGDPGFQQVHGESQLEAHGREQPRWIPHHPNPPDLSRLHSQFRNGRQRGDHARPHTRHREIPGQRPLRGGGCGP